MRPERLQDWLTWQESLHPKAIDLGLERCAEVARRLDLDAPDFPVITVAGTNGKGSCVAMLEGILGSAGYRVGAYTSPHLTRYNERIRIGGREIDDAALVSAFQRIDEARGNLSLTYFEFGTLAAVWLMKSAGVDAALLEVGLGGRLDAVNVWDADAALVTGIGVDHRDWLGAEREGIGREKAGVFRPGRTAVCSDPCPPLSIAGCALATGADLFQLGVDFQHRAESAGWDWVSPRGTLQDLPMPGLNGAFQLDNAAGVLMVLECLEQTLPVPLAAVRAGIAGSVAPGRIQLLPGATPRIVDIAHNPHAVGGLAAWLRAHPCSGRTLAVLGVLEGKDAAGMVLELRDEVDAWLITGVPGPRGMSARALARELECAGVEVPVSLHPDVAHAQAQALADAGRGGRVVVFGSFHVAGEALRLAREGASPCDTRRVDARDPSAAAAAGKPGPGRGARV